MLYTDVPAGLTLPIMFSTFGKTNGESITMSGLAVTDIEIYKAVSMTQRSSDNGYALIDTDGIDIDGITGIHGFSIDLSDNSDSGFYAVGSFYNVVVSTITVDGQTVSFIAERFRIIAAEATAGYRSVNATHINKVATTSVTTINANQGTTSPILFTSSLYVRSDVRMVGASLEGATNFNSVFLNTPFATAWNSDLSTWRVDVATVDEFAQTGGDIFGGITSIRDKTDDLTYGVANTLNVNVTHANQVAVKTDNKGYFQTVPPESTFVAWATSDVSSGSALKSEAEAATYRHVFFGSGTFDLGSGGIAIPDKVYLEGAGKYLSTVTSTKSNAMFVAAEGKSGLRSMHLHSTGPNGDCWMSPFDTAEIDAELVDVVFENDGGQTVYINSNDTGRLLVDGCINVGNGASIRAEGGNQVITILNSFMHGSADPSLSAEAGGKIIGSNNAFVTTTGGDSVESIVATNDDSEVAMSNSSFWGAGATSVSATSNAKIVLMNCPRRRGTDVASGGGTVTDTMDVLRPTTQGRTLKVSSSNFADAQTILVGPTGSGTAQTAGDLKTLIDGAASSAATAATQATTAATQSTTAATQSTAAASSSAAAKLVTDKLETTLESAGGGDYKFTEPALEEAPTGDGGGGIALDDELELGGTVGEALQAALAQGTGKWSLNQASRLMTMYAPDGTTVVATFLLGPNLTTPLTRTPQ